MSLSILENIRGTELPECVDCFSPEPLELQHFEVTLQDRQHVGVLEVAVDHLFYFLTIVFVVQGLGDLFVLLGDELEVRVGESVGLDVLLEVAELAFLETAVGDVVHLEDLLLVVVLQFQEFVGRLALQVVLLLALHDLDDLGDYVHLAVAVCHDTYHAALDGLLEEVLPADLLEEGPGQTDLLEVFEFYLDCVLLCWLAVRGWFGVF